MKLIIVGAEEAVEKDTLYIRSREDEDGDFLVEVSKTSNFEQPRKLAFFSSSDGKLRLSTFSGLGGFEAFIHTDEHGQIEID